MSLSERTRSVSPPLRTLYLETPDLNDVVYEIIFTSVVKGGRVVYSRK